MARMLIGALRTSGHDVVLASRFRSVLPSPDPDAMRDVEAAALREVDRLIAGWQGSPSGPPDVWFTYHPYYKAPDLIGARRRCAVRDDLRDGRGLPRRQTRCRSLGDVAYRQRGLDQGRGDARLLHAAGCRGARGPRRPRCHCHAAALPRARPFRHRDAADARPGPRGPRDGRDDAAGRQDPLLRVPGRGAGEPARRLAVASHHRRRRAGASRGRTGRSASFRPAD